MKKNRTMRVATLLLALTLITSCFVGGTFAKYTSSATATSTATVAKWDIKVNNTDITQNDSVTINLFDTINDTGNTDDETDVVDNKIAPGTSGSFALEVTNASEVNAVYSLSFGINNNSNIPLQFSTDGHTWKDSIAGIAVNDVEINMNGASNTTTVYWQWPFERGTGDELVANDTADTDLGIAAQTAAPSVEVTATITATQVD